MRAGPDTLEWLRSYYEALDHRRFEEIALRFHEDCATTYPNGATIAGRDRMIAIMRRSLGSLAGISHVLKGAWEQDDELIFELEVTYRRRDGEVIIRPGVGIFVRDERSGLIRQQRLFVDAAGVWD